MLGLTVLTDRASDAGQSSSSPIVKLPIAFATVGLVSAVACSDRSTIVQPAPNGGAKSSLHLDVASASQPGPITSEVPLPNVCIDIEGGTASAPAAGASLQAWQCHGGANQQFTMQANGTITAYNGALCLDVWQAQANDGDPVVAYSCTGGTNQRWTYTSAGQLQTAVNGKCLDLWGAQGQNGAPIKVWPCHGGANQKWALPPASVSVSPPTTPITVSASGSTAGSAELPRTYLNTAMPAVTGRTISVPAGGDLQGALNAAQPGDQVVLAAGATFTGNFVLPAKAGMTGAQWITVRTGGALPAEGARVGPGDAAQMPKLLTPNNFAPSLSTAVGAQGWRVTGVEISSAPGTTWNYSLVNFGSVGTDQNTAASVPSRIVLDRSYVHGSDSFDLRRCVTLNSASSAVINSYLAGCHSNNNESQAILGWNGPGPLKISNNHLEGGHQVIMFGGSDPSVQGSVSSDIEIRRNHIMRPLNWKGVWQVKNLIEIKTAQRVLIEGNVIENNWADAQNGFAFVWWSADESGSCTWCRTQDITFRYNRVNNVPQGFNLAASSVSGGLQMQRVTIAHNVITGVRAAGGRLFQVNGNVSGVTIANNSGLGGSQDIYFVTPDQALPTFVYRDNVTGGEYTLFGDGGFMGPTALTQLKIPSESVTGNVIYSGSGSRAIPAGNTYVSSPSAIGFVDLDGGNLTLSSSSAYLRSGTNSTLPGADMSTISSLTAGVVR